GSQQTERVGFVHSEEWGAAVVGVGASGQGPAGRQLATSDLRDTSEPLYKLNHD
ncbi:hypothetical protein K0M31_016832, partial [Melipona bicolor]